MKEVGGEMKTYLPFVIRSTFPFSSTVGPCSACASRLAA